MSNASASANASTGGVGFLGFLSLLLAAGKIFNFQDYSWWVVFAPVLAGLAIFVVFALLALVFILIKDAKDRKARAAARERQRELRTRGRR